MNSKSFFHTIRLHLGITLFVLIGTHSLYPETAMPPMSDAELAELEQMGQQMQAEIDDFVSKMPEEEQKKFWEDVNALTDEMSKMNPEELDKFIGDVFAEPTAPMPPTPVEQVQPTPSPIEQPVVEKTKAEPKKPKVPKKQIEKIALLLKEIIEHIESFLQKAQVIIDLQRKVEKWGRAGLIPLWKGTDTWNEIQTTAVRLACKINLLLSQDPKTKEYRFMENLLKDKGLINNLELFNKKISEESRIEVPEFDIPEQDGIKLTLPSKQSIRKTVDAIIEAQTLLKIFESIDSIIAKFGPLAEKIRKEEQDAVRKALAALQQPRIPGSVRIIGSPEQAPYTGPTYPGASGSPGYGGYGGYTPSYSQPSAPSQPSKVSETTDTKDATTKKEPPILPGSAKTTPESDSEKRTKQHVESIEVNLEEALDALAQINGIHNFKQVLTTTGSTNDALIDGFNMFHSALKGATTAIRSFNTSVKTLPASVRNKYMDQVRKAVGEPIGKIDKFKKELESIVANVTPAYIIVQKIPGAISSLERSIERMGK